MKKGLIIVYIIIAIGAVAAIMAMRLSPRTVPYEQCSEVYKRYHAVEGVEASYVKDYRLNDTMRIDVTFLQATTDEGWQKLKEDFNLIDLPPEYGEFDEKADEHTIESRRSPKDDPYHSIEPFKGRSDDLSVAVSRYKHQVCIFHTENEAGIGAVLAHLLNEISPNTPAV